MRIDRLPDGRFAIKSAYNAQMVAACKAVPGMVWDPELRVWAGYEDALAVFAALWPAIKPALAELEDRAAADAIWLGADNTAGLRQYQIEGAAFLVNAAGHGALLADVMGAGKTAQALRAARALNQRTLIVCPSFVRGVWEKELKKWWPDAGVGVLEGVKDVGAILPQLVILCHYDILHAWVEALTEYGPKTLILDEAHYASNGKSRRSGACKTLAAQATHRMALTGTPLTNRPRDLWNVVDTISPGRFGSFFSYAKRYCDATQKTVGMGASAKVVWEFDGRSNLDELNRRLSYFMLRRTHADINLELPALTRQVVELKVPARYKLNVDRGVKARDMRRALDLAADGKLKEIVAMCRQHVEDGHKVVVFCHRRAAAEHIAFEVADANSSFTDFIHGGVPQKKRDAAIEAFRNWEGAGMLVATIDIASVGIDLSFADVCVFAELTWEPHELAQAEARVYRFGAKKPILVQYCIALGTGEELIRDAVIGKMKQVMEPALGGKEELATALQGPMTDEEALRQLWEAL